MIFVENYELAKEYHEKVLTCWFIHKLYDADQPERDNYRCDLLNCECCKEINDKGDYIERKYYANLNDSTRIFLQTNFKFIISNDFNVMSIGQIDQ